MKFFDAVFDWACWFFVVSASVAMTLFAFTSVFNFVVSFSFLYG